MSWLPSLVGTISDVMGPIVKDVLEDVDEHEANLREGRFESQSGDERFRDEEEDDHRAHEVMAGLFSSISGGKEVPGLQKKYDSGEEYQQVKHGAQTSARRQRQRKDVVRRSSRRSGSESYDEQQESTRQQSKQRGVVAQRRSSKYQSEIARQGYDDAEEIFSAKSHVSDDGKASYGTNRSIRSDLSESSDYEHVLSSPQESVSTPTQLETNIAAFGSQSDECRTQHADKENTIHQLEQRLVDIENKLRQSIEHGSLLSDKLTQSKETVKVMENKTKELEDRISTSTELRDDLELRLEERESQIKKLEALLAAQKLKEKDSLISFQTEIDERIQSLSCELDAKNQSLQEATQRVIQSEQLLTESSLRLGASENEAKELRREVEVLHAQLNEMKEVEGKGVEVAAREDPKAMLASVGDGNTSKNSLAEQIRQIGIRLMQVAVEDEEMDLLRTLTEVNDEIKTILPELSSQIDENDISTLKSELEVKFRELDCTRKRLEEESSEVAREREVETAAYRKELEDYRLKFKTMEDERENITMEKTRLAQQLEEALEETQKVKELAKAERSKDLVDVEAELQTAFRQHEEELRRCSSKWEEKEQALLQQLDVVQKSAAKSKQVQEDEMRRFDEHLATLTTKMEKMMEDERGLVAELAEYRAENSELERSLNEAKRLTSKTEGEKAMLRQQVENLQEELKKKTQAHQKGVSSLTGQFEELKRLRSVVEEGQEREAALKQEIDDLNASQQTIHRLSNELQATKAELQMAQSDITRFTREQKDLHVALSRISQERERQVENFEEKLRQKVNEAYDLQKLLESERQSFDSSKSAHLKAESTLRDQLDAAQVQIEELSGKISALEQAAWSRPRSNRSLHRGSSFTSQQDQQETRSRSFSNRSINSLASGNAESGTDGALGLECTSQPLASPSGGDVEPASPAPTTAGEAFPMDGLDEPEYDRDMLKNLIVQYFQSRHSGTYQSQREILILLSQALDMDDDEKVAVGLLEPKQGKFAKSKEPIGLFGRLLFGSEPEEKLAKEPIDWNGIEEAVKSKPFSDLFDDILSKSM